MIIAGLISALALRYARPSIFWVLGYEVTAACHRLGVEPVGTLRINADHLGDQFLRWELQLSRVGPPRV